ncbi:TIGR03862 family flavoprotein [Pseudomonas sp.]|uniref:TIGR03862 family flavoprotein n=1 Tax=Pseudomonas sp. TaxID=306 RepID=UPI00289E07FF|nr:TIGR03862 family flavoprotein [Pseudomonas sp.]
MSPHVPTHSRTAAIIGGGPAGLMAAEVLAGTGVTVDVYDGMPSVGRKFLLAGVGGMNITHAEDQPAFRSRYRERETALSRCLDGFDSRSLRDWIHGLGIETFVGSSGRVFPSDMKAAPLLRAWLHRLREAGVRIHTRHRWLGWDEHGALRFSTPAGETCLRAEATVLALGGASWPRLGTDGVWTGYLEEQGIALAPLQPANCGFEVAQWSNHLRSKFAGSPIKPVAMMLKDGTRRQGEFVLTETGIEGSLVYALSAEIRTELLRTGSATLYLDLAPTKEQSALAAALSKPRKGKSMANHLRAHAGLEGARSALLRELAPAKAFDDMQHLAAAIKSLPLTVIRPRPIEEAISSAGGVPFEALNEQLMFNALPGVFCAGEMLDWEAPTGGYLLTACFATGRTAGLGAAAWLQQ